MGVVPVQACRAGGELDERAAAGGNHGRAFFHGAVDVGWNPLPVPVHDFRAIELVEDLHGDRFAFSEMKHPARNLAAVCRGADVLFRGELPLDLCDFDGVVGSRAGGIGGGRTGGRGLGPDAGRRAVRHQSGGCKARVSQEPAPAALTG